MPEEKKPIASVTVDNGKYTFRVEEHTGAVRCFRFDSPWVEFDKGSKALIALICDHERLLEDRQKASGNPCQACLIEAEIGTEENPHPVPERFHTCSPVGAPGRRP